MIILRISHKHMFSTRLATIEICRATSTGLHLYILVTILTPNRVYNKKRKSLVQTTKNNSLCIGNGIRYISTKNLIHHQKRRKFRRTLTPTSVSIKWLKNHVTSPKLKIQRIWDQKRQKINLRRNKSELIL